MAERVAKTLSYEIRVDDDVVPLEYIKFQFAREFHLTPDQVDNMDAATFWLWIGFMNAEGQKAKVLK